MKIKYVYNANHFQHISHFILSSCVCVCLLKTPNTDECRDLLLSTYTYTKKDVKRHTFEWINLQNAYIFVWVITFLSLSCFCVCVFACMYVCLYMYFVHEKKETCCVSVFLLLFYKEGKICENLVNMCRILYIFCVTLSHTHACKIYISGDIGKCFIIR